MTGKTLHFIGVDISKLYVDASLLTVVDHVKKEIVSERFENTHAGMKTFSKWLKNYKVSFNGNTLLVIENTGIYHRLNNPLDLFLVMNRVLRRFRFCLLLFYNLQICIIKTNHRQRRIITTSGLNTQGGIQSTAGFFSLGDHITIRV